jgi:hypothetical protein
MPEHSRRRSKKAYRCQSGLFNLGCCNKRFVGGIDFLSFKRDLSVHSWQLKLVNAIFLIALKP